MLRLPLRRVPPRHFQSHPSRASTFLRLGIMKLAPTLTCRRHFHLEGMAVAPVMFGGLFAGLWTWKCIMMVVFQNKIIYMPGLPPNARWERIQDYAAECGGVQWREERVRAVDGTDLALCVADVDLGRDSSSSSSMAKGGGQVSERPSDASLYILYFQGPHFFWLYFHLFLHQVVGIFRFVTRHAHKWMTGNASSIPPRLRDLSSALCMLKRRMHQEARSIRVTFVCLSYRGYWTSRGRPTEKGIRLDAAAALRWISQNYEKSSSGGSSQAHQSLNPTTARPAEVLLWGQSIGSGVATNLAAECSMPGNLHLNSLILETPFTSIRAMLEVLYPQKWLPYKYLWPFLRNHLDSWSNLGTIAERYKSHEHPPRIFILEAAKDELVPAELSQKLYDRSVEVGLPVERKAVSGAFHNDTMFRAEGRRAVSDFIAQRIGDLN